MVVSPGNAAHEESRLDQATSQQRIQKPVSSCHRMGLKRHAARDREKRIGDTRRKEPLRRMPQTQSAHSCPTGGRRSGTHPGHIGQHRSALLHWVQEPGKASSINNRVKIQDGPRQACKKQTIAPVARNVSSSCRRGYHTWIYSGNATRVRQHAARVITKKLERYGKEARRRDREPQKKNWTTTKNEEIHIHHVRDYKKRRRDRNSNMQPLTCSSSDAAMETATNPQMDTSYSRRQRPHEGEIPEEATISDTS